MQKYDVIIVGGGASGCSCAWNCGRLGLKTLLIESESYLGGTISGSLVIPVMKSGENQINTDFYSELITQMKKVNGQITYQGNPGWFNPFLIKNVLYNMISEKNVDVALSVSIDKVYADNNLIQKVEMLSECIEAKYFVDCTGNLNFSEKINCSFLENNYDNQPVSLRFVMSDVNLDKFGKWLLEIDCNRDITTVENIDGHTHLSTAYTWDTDKKWALAPYFENAVKNNELKDSDRNYFQVFSIAGMDGGIAFNCPRIIDNCKNPYTYGRDVISRLSAFCVKYLPGFENAKIYKIADKLGIRSGRRIKGKYVYTIDDLRSGKKFDNPAVISNYPVDVHSRQKNGYTLEQTGEYQLPIESLMSADYDNLFIAGRGLSADEYAQGALRVQASCFSMGEAVAQYIKNII